MRLLNPWVGYLQRTYQDAKQSILNRLRTYTPEITDYNESNILVILVSIFSGILEQFNYYIDNRARESFLPTAQRYSSVVKIVNLLDYRVKAAVPASVDLYFTYIDENGSPVAITEPGVIPQGTLVTTDNGLSWLTTKTLTIPIGTSFGKVSAKQTSAVEGVSLGTTTTQPSQEYIIPGQYAQGSLQIEINGEPWELVETLARSLPTDKHYIVDIKEDQIPRVVFGDGVRGQIPGAGQDILADYFITQGATGNNIARGMINKVESVLVLPDPATNIVVRNELPPVGGSNQENLEMIKVNAPLSIRTVGGAITKSDFETIAQQVPGVGKALSIYRCGPDVDVYISPVGGGTASSSLIEDTEEYLSELTTITTSVTVKPAGETPVVIQLEVRPRFRVNTVDLTNEIMTALLDTFSFENNQINGRVAVSDILAVVDNIPRVDTVDLSKLITLPYATPLRTAGPLVWERETLPGSSQQITWRLVFDGTNFRLFKASSLIDIVEINTVYQDPENIIALRIDPAGMYVTGDTWEFITHPYNQTIKLNDNTVPVVTAGTIIININQVS